MRLGKETRYFFGLIRGRKKPIEKPAIFLASGRKETLGIFNCYTIADRVTFPRGLPYPRSAAESNQEVTLFVSEVAALPTRARTCAGGTIFRSEVLVDMDAKKPPRQSLGAKIDEFRRLINP